MAKTDLERAEEIVRRHAPKALLTHPEAAILVEIGIRAGLQMARIKISKGPADLDGDHD